KARRACSKHAARQARKQEWPVVLRPVPEAAGTAERAEGREPQDSTNDQREPDTWAGARRDHERTAGRSGCQRSKKDARRRRRRERRSQDPDQQRERDRTGPQRAPRWRSEFAL